MAELWEGFATFSKDMKAILDRMDARVELNSSNTQRVLEGSAMEDKLLNRTVAVVEHLEQRIDALETPNRIHDVISETAATQTGGPNVLFDAEESRIRPPSGDVNSEGHLDQQRQLDMSALVLQKLEYFERQLHNVADRNDRVGGS